MGEEVPGLVYFYTDDNVLQLPSFPTLKWSISSERKKKSKQD
jgi:hypothetical protein